MNQKDASQFYNLTPHQVLDAVQAAGYMPTGEYIQLNSYENRVFDIFLEATQAGLSLNQRVIAKFYRPQRWTEQALLEEHQFLFDLKEAGLPVIAPLKFGSPVSSLHKKDDIWFTLFPKGLGRLPQELSKQQYQQVGRFLAQLHNVGAKKVAKHRPTFDVETYGWRNLDLLEDWVAPEISTRYFEAADSICDYLEEILDPSKFIRIHGDCHRGNLLIWDRVGEPERYFIVDFDDFVQGPVEQDFWMLLPGDIEGGEQELNWIFDGYDEFREPPLKDIGLYKALQGLRIIHYSAWIARRYEDPSFKKIFPDFQEYLYWVDEAESLEKIAWSL